MSGASPAEPPELGTHEDWCARLVSPVDKPELRIRRAFSDRELAQLQKTGTVMLNTGIFADGIRLSAITVALALLGIDTADVVLHGTQTNNIAVKVSPDAAVRADTPPRPEDAVSGG